MSSLLTELGAEYKKKFQKRSITDWLVDVMTPIMIFIMVSSIVFFLIDVRYIYTGFHFPGFRFMAFCFVMGIVALNRLIARDGKEESFVYAVGLVVAVGIYTLSTSSVNSLGSVAPGLMNKPYVATAFNMCVVAFIWWVTNRLTHECCVDTNPTAGDVGILTGAARSFRESLKKKPEKTLTIFPKKQKKEPLILRTELEPVDPRDWKPPEKTRPKAPPEESVSERLPKRHPGISIFYLSVPVMVIFALGLPVLLNGDHSMVQSGHFYVGSYTVAALSLLMLSSLGGLREYFRSRRVYIPAGLGPFWIGLGTVMLIVVLIGAVSLPMPGLPRLAYIPQPEFSTWSPRFFLRWRSVVATPADIVEQAQIVQKVSIGVLVCLGLFLGYGALRGLGALAVGLARYRHLLPGFVVRLLRAIDRMLQRLLRVPALPRIPRRRRISRDVALCAQYSNPLADAEESARMTPADVIAVSYEALCALAYDLGVPRRDDQTPYEFIEAFPKPLTTLREEAAELTALYVRAAYSPESLDPRVLDRVRKFWLSYEMVRRRVVR